MGVNLGSSSGDSVAAGLFVLFSIRGQFYSFPDIPPAFQTGQVHTLLPGETQSFKAHVQAFLAFRCLISLRKTNLRLAGNGDLYSMCDFPRRDLS